MTADGDPEQVSALLALLPEAEAQRTRRGGVKRAQAAYGLPAQLTPTPAAAALPPIVLLQLELPLAPMLAVAATARERGCSVALKASCIPPPTNHGAARRLSAAHLPSPPRRVARRRRRCPRTTFQRRTS